MEEPGEFNLLLPLAFGFIIFLFFAVGTFIFWLLRRSSIIRLTEKYHLLSAAKNVALSLLGVFGFLLILPIILFVFQVIYSLLTYLVKIIL